MVGRAGTPACDSSTPLAPKKQDGETLLVQCVAAVLFHSGGGGGFHTVKVCGNAVYRKTLGETIDTFDSIKCHVSTA